MNITPMTMGLQRANAASTPNNNTNVTPNQSANNAEQTFLSLLVTELKSQDPTSPMDPTQMVGQMLSMNQLNELISINQTLQNALGTSATSASTQTNNPYISSVSGAH